MILKRKAGIEVPPIDDTLGRIVDLDEQIRQGVENLKIDGLFDKNEQPKKEAELNDSLHSFNDDDNVVDDDDDDEQQSQSNDDANNFVETELKKPTVETKRKLRKLIERRYRMRKSSDNTDVAIKKGTTKSNIKHIIRSEKIKELIENISQMDLKSLCDLDTTTTKSCLLKIIDSYDLD